MKREGTLMERVKGRAAENFFARTMGLFTENKFESPPWILEVRRATRRQDLNGIDFIVTTDIGEINVQIKSSVGYAERYKKSHAKAPFEVCIIVLSEEDTHVSLFRRTRNVLAKRRQKLLSGIQQRFILSTPPSKAAR